MSSTHTDKCPSCKKEITVNVERWNTECNCPECGATIEVCFDMIIMDDGDEWDIYEFKMADA